MLDLANPVDRETLEQLISDDVDAFCATYYESGHRNHLGASELGEECWRKLWYGFRWVKQEVFDGRMLRLFNVGHSAEPRFITYLRGVGFEVREFSTPVLSYNPIFDDYEWREILDPAFGPDLSNDPNHVSEAAKRGIKPKQFRIAGANGHYGGSLDGMCKPPARYEIIGDLILLNEYKTNNTGQGYTKVEDKGVAKAKPKHFAQMSQYGYKYGLHYGLYMIENKNDSDITFKIVELDWNLGAQMERKAEEIIFAKEPPARISDNPAFFTCKEMCHLKDICHNSEVPEKNCRSCRQAMPTNNAEWFCAIAQQNIPSDVIPKGCPQWLPI
jgi:hypothetical protein